MNHNPFCSINSNFYDESFRSTAPTTLNGENVVLSQEQQRRVSDTVNTSVIGFSGNQSMLCAQKQLVPGGVLFTFPASTNAAQAQCSMYPPQVQPPPQAVVSSFFPSSVEYSQLNPCGFQQPQQTFNLQFHRNSSSSCSDLPSYFPKVPAPKEFTSSTPKNCQQCQTMQQLMFPGPPIDFSSRVKKLVLCKTVDAPTGHVVDVLDPNADKQKKVSFSEGQQATKEEGIQMTSECICDSKKCKRQSKKSKGKARSQEQSDSSSVGSQSNGQSSEEEAKPRKKRRRNRKKKGDKDEQSSENGAQSKRRKGKHKLKKGESSELSSGLSSEEFLVTTSSSNTSTGSDNCQCL